MRDDNEIIRLGTAARQLGVSPYTLRALCRSGQGPTLIRLNCRGWYGIERAELQRFIESRRVPAAAQVAA